MGLTKLPPNMIGSGEPTHRVFKTLLEMKSDKTLKPGETATVLGNKVVGDGNGGNYIICNADDPIPTRSTPIVLDASNCIAILVLGRGIYQSVEDFESAIASGCHFEENETVIVRGIPYVYDGGQKLYTLPGWSCKVVEKTTLYLNGTGATSSFSIPFNIYGADIEVFVEGVSKHRDVDYVVTDTNLIFNYTPDFGVNNIKVIVTNGINSNTWM